MAAPTSEPSHYEAGPPVSPPTEIQLAVDRLSMLIVWTGETRDRLEAAQLREACRCAFCVKQRHDGTFPAHFPGVTITGLETMGSHALNVRFSDGHDRGIFPWPYLKQLTQRGN
jgi:DUF971 family protein